MLFSEIATELHLRYIMRCMFKKISCSWLFSLQNRRYFLRFSGEHEYNHIVSAEHDSRVTGPGRTPESLLHAGFWMST